MNASPRFDHARFSALLDDLRTREGLTYPEAAERLQASRHNLWRLRRGKHSPSFATFARIVQHLDVEPGALIEGR